MIILILFINKVETNRHLKEGTMKKSTKSRIIAFLVILIVGGFLFSLMDHTYTSTIRLNWSIKLPAPTKQIYSIDNFGDGWFGEGEKYHVLTYHDSTKIIKSLEWKSGRYPLAETEVLKILENLKVPEANLPDFQKTYLYYIKRDQSEGSTIYLIYFTDIKTLYVIENIF